TGFVGVVARETRTIPVVFANVSDPVGAGFVESLRRPGGNMTGLMSCEDSIAGKWLSMLKEASPSLKRAALLLDPTTTPHDYFFRPMEAVASSLGVSLVSSRIENPAGITHAIEALARESGSGFVVAPGSTVLRNRKLIITLAAQHGLPAVYPDRIYARDAGLMSYGVADLT